MQCVCLLSSVFVCTFGAGGVGLTLTAARTVILLDRPWTPGDVAQAEDRVRRIGQRFPVKNIWISAFEVDKQIDLSIESKLQTSNTVLTTSGETGGLSASAPKISIMKLVASMLPVASAPGEASTLSQTSINSYVQRN